MLPDNTVTSEGDLFQFALLADIEPIDSSEAMKERAWKDTMAKELKANKTRELTELPPKKKHIEVK